jgi:hypothetical protein
MIPTTFEGKHKTMKLYLLYSEYRSGGEICEGQEDDQWPNYEDVYVEWDLLHCKLSRHERERNCEEVDVPFEVKRGDTVYVVYVRYGTGGTFGHTVGAWNIVGVYNNLDEAAALESSINDGSYEKRKGIYVPWTGYFGCFESCDIKYMTVKE